MAEAGENPKTRVGRRGRVSTKDRQKTDKRPTKDRQKNIQKNIQSRFSCVLTRSFCLDDKLHARAQRTRQTRNRSKNSRVRKICIYARKAVTLQPNSKTAYKMEKKQEIKFDERNYRKHGTENKRIIKKSLEELGAGRSIVIDNEGEIIAGNGVYEQAQKLGIKTKIVETDGSELVVVKRTDLATGDDKRKKLALADNATSDTSEWANDLLREDWTKEALAEFGVTLPDMNVEEDEKSDLSDKINLSYRVEVTCSCEKEQETLFDQLTSEGYQCRILTL